MLISLINGKSSKEDFKKHYSAFTLVEKTMVDRGYVWMDDLYPSLYWKIIAGIFYIINKRDMDPIDDKYKSISIDEDATRIRSSSEGEQVKTRTIYDIYVNFKLAYRPFKKNNIDVKLQKLGYPVECITSVKDKLILFVKDFAVQGKLHPVESELCKSISFLLSLNFMSFYESLLNFEYEPIEYVFDSPSYDILYHESHIFRELRDKDIYKPSEKIIHDVANVIVETGRPRVILALKKILLGNFMVRIEDLFLTLYFCREFFTSSVASLYIHDILCMMKYRNVSIAIVVMFEPKLAQDYVLIEPTIEYIVANSNKLDIKQLPITISNYFSVINSCNTINKLTTVIDIIKENRWLIVNDYINTSFRAILKKQPVSSIDLFNLQYVIDTFSISIDNRYELFASYIRLSNKNLIDTAMKEKWNYDDIRLIEAVGESCNVDNLLRVYGIGPYTDEFIKTVVLSCYRKGSSLFSDYFTDRNLINVTDSEIINNVIISKNVCIVEKFRLSLNITNVDDLLVKVIVNDNFPVFIYFLSTIDKHYLNMRTLILTAALHNRHTMLLCLFDDHSSLNKDHIKVTGNNPNGNSFYLSILYQCVYSINSYTLSLFFSKMTYDYNNIHIQKFTLNRLFRKIYKSSNRQWLEDNIKICHTVSCNNDSKKVKITNDKINEDYISSDSDSDSEDDLQMSVYI